MKILVVKPGPLFSVEDVANGWIKGLTNLGHDVVTFDLGEKMSYFANANELMRKGERDPTKDAENAALLAAEVLAGSCWQHQPDVVLIITGYYLPPIFYDLARKQHKVVLMVTESPYEDDRHLLQASHCDMLVVNDTRNLEAFNEITPSFYYGHGYDPDIHYQGKGDINFISEFCFVGTGFPERIEMFEQIDWNKLEAVFAGNWLYTEDDSPLRQLVVHDLDDCVDNKIAAQIYRSSLMSANIYRKQHTYSYDGDSCGPREIEMAACGLFFLRESRKESDEIFHMLPTFDGAKDLENKIHYWLVHPDERNAKAEQAKKAIVDRSFDVLAEQFINDLKTL